MFDFHARTMIKAPRITKSLYGGLKDGSLDTELCKKPCAAANP